MGNLSCKKHDPTKSKKANESCLSQKISRSHLYSSIVIKSSTCTKETNSLFDYENTFLVRKSVKTAGSCNFLILILLGKIYLVEHDVVIKNDDKLPEKPFPTARIEKLLNLSYNKGIYKIRTEKEKSEKTDDYNIYIVVKYLNREKLPFQQGQYELREGDIIKMGRIKFCVTELRKNEIPRENPSSKPFSLRKISEALSLVSEKSSKSDTSKPEPIKMEATQSDLEPDSCRFCRSEKNSSENPLISICKCSGSVKFVHAECIKAWFQAKTTVKTSPNVTTFAIKNLECELCKTKLPLTIEKNGNLIKLIEIPRPQNIPYIMLESMDDQVSNLKCIHVFYCKNEPSIAKIVFFLFKYKK